MISLNSSSRNRSAERLQQTLIADVLELRKQVLFFLLLSVAVFQALFASMPWIDLWFSSLFWTPGAGFEVANMPGFELYREFANQAYIALGLLALFGGLLTLSGRRTLKILGNIWLFIVALYLLGPALLVNGVLKAYWGRARPEHIVDFGGDLLFSPPFEIAAQCVSNCSFVSGEAAGATAFAISAYVLTRFLSSAMWRNLLFGTALTLSVSGAFLRIVFGRHFLSDVIFSVLFVSLIAVVLSYFFIREAAPYERQIKATG